MKPIQKQHFLTILSIEQLFFTSIDESQVFPVKPNFINYYGRKNTDIFTKQRNTSFTVFKFTMGIPYFYSYEAQVPALETQTTSTNRHPAGLRGTTRVRVSNV